MSNVQAALIGSSRKRINTELGVQFGFGDRKSFIIEVKVEGISPRTEFRLRLRGSVVFGLKCLEMDMPPPFRLI